MDKSTFLSYLHASDFGALFRESGWNNPTSRDPLEIMVGETPYTFAEAAQQRGFRVFVCKTGTLPSATVCRQLDAKLRKMSHYYLAVFVSTSQTDSFHHLWSVPVKSVDKRQLVSVEYCQDEQASFLREKLGMISFSDDETPTIVDVEDRVNKAFLVNSAEVTKSFYKSFKDQHTLFVEEMEGIWDDDDRKWYASVMLTRLMFCYFIQKKGFLNLDKEYLQHKLAAVQEKRGRDRFYGTFYKRFLRKLFESGLNGKGRSEAFKREFGIIPYLNGGMFELHVIEKKYPDLDIPDTVFEELFDFFDQWHWHLDTRLTASGRDINPDVLGYIFEQYVNERTRTDKGAYYTQEDITEYIGRNCIMPWLLEKVFGSERIPKWAEKTLRSSHDDYLFPAMLKGMDLPLPPEIEKGVDPTAPDLLARRAEWNQPSPEPYALPTEIWRETVARRQRCQEVRERIAAGAIATPDDFITFNLDIRKFSEDLLLKTTDHLFVGKFYKAIREITILDPTCGSGAFLFAALNILEPLYEACLDRMEEFNSGNPRLFKDELGEIKAKYRSNQKYFIYKNIILRNLYGVDIMHEATEIARLRLFLKMMAVVDVDPYDENLGLEPLPDIDFNIKCGNTLVGYTSAADIQLGLGTGDVIAYYELKQKIGDELLKISTANHRFRETQLLPSATAAELAEQKRELQTRLKTIEALLNKQLHDPASRQSLASWVASVQPFHWYAEFHDIMANRGGFDVIIGNPPYVSAKTIEYECTFLLADEKKMPDIYSWCILRSFALNEQNGRFGMIVPLSVTFSGDFRPLRAKLLQQACWVSSFDNIPASVFEAVSQRCSIVLAHKGQASLFSTRLYRWRAIFRKHLTSVLEYIPASPYKAGILKCPSPVLSEIAEKVVPMGFAETRHSNHKLWFSTTARNYISAFLIPPPCLNVLTLENELPSKISSLSFEDDNEMFATYCACGGDFAFLLWLMVGDGFDVTKGNLTSIAGAIQKLDAPAKKILAKLGRQLDRRHFEGLSFKKNAGKYVGSFNYMMLKDITRRGDALLLAALGFSKTAILELFDWYVRILSINDNLGEKGIPPEIRAMFPPGRYNRRAQDALFEETDNFLVSQYGFTAGELAFIINYDIKNREADED